MNISSTSDFSTTMMMNSMMPQRPNASEMSSKIMEQSDSDGDSSLSIEELGISEESYAAMDTDGDGLVSSSELESSISSQLESVKNGEMSKEDFKSFMSELGLEGPDENEMGHGMPPPPPSSSDFASMVMESSDTDGDGSLSSSEIGSEETFDALDTNEDGVVSAEELQAGIEEQMQSVQNGESSMEDFDSFMSALGVEKPEKGEGMPPPPPPGEENSDSLSELTNLTSTLLEALNSESGEDNSIDLSTFSSIMKMFNNETQNASTATQLNAYVSNLNINLQTA